MGGGQAAAASADPALLSADFNAYLEPFAGSAAVFFDLHTSGAARFQAVTLIDINHDLIGCYVTVRDRPSEVIAALRELEMQYRTGGEQHLLQGSRRAIQSAPRSRLAVGTRRQLAAMLIFLNRTGFNGLFRLNSSGAFNVPHGPYANPSICDEDNIRAVASNAGAIRGPAAERGPFDAVAGVARPPATSSTSIRRTRRSAPRRCSPSYTAGGLRSARIKNGCRDVVVQLVRERVSVLLSNSTRAGDRATCTTLPAMRKRRHGRAHRAARSGRSTPTRRRAGTWTNT